MPERLEARVSTGRESSTVGLQNWPENVEQTQPGRVMNNMMRNKDFILIQLLLWLAVFVVMQLPVAHAALPATPAQQMQASQIQTVQTLEETLFTVQYGQDPLKARLSRLEETVFGEAKPTLSDAERIGRLKSALSANTLTPLKPSPPQTEPVKQAPVAKQQQLPTAQTATQSAPIYKAAPSAGETDYPMVTQMESKLFGKTFVQEDVTQRLTRLEKQVFKTVQTGALADRVDNLRLVVLGDTGSGNGAPVARQQQSYPSQDPDMNPAYSQFPVGPPQTASKSASSKQSQVAYATPYSGGNAGYPQIPTPPQFPSAGNNGYYNNGGMPAALPGNQSDYGEQPVSYNGVSQPPTPDMLAAIDEVEKEVLGHTYSAEPFNTRLDRIESKIFNGTSPEMSNEDRMQRVIAVASAGGAPQSTKAKAKTTFQTLLPIILTILPMLLL